MNAEEVIRQAIKDWPHGSMLSEPAFIERALRAACGGGPVVILDDGTLATLNKLGQWVLATPYKVVTAYGVVPVGES